MTMCDSDSGLSFSMDGQSDLSNLVPPQGSVFIKVTVPDLNAEKLLQFQLNESVADAKRMAISVLGQSLKDSLNYGLFLPGSNGKAGKFLQEDRSLKDYPFQGVVGQIVLKYKHRVYQSMSINPNKLKKLHAKSNLREFIHCVKLGEHQKVLKWLNKGIDPNFHCRESGDSPIGLTVHLTRPQEMIMALVGCGAHLDFKSKTGMTALHKACIVGNYEAVKTFLDLGQSPNVYDLKGLTPLYYAVCHDNLAQCIEKLLYEHSVLGVVDDKRMQEIHQACYHGRTQHLEHLLSYGADLNSATSDGDTPLHICARRGQDSCARLLLFRGAQRGLLNQEGRTAYQEAALNNHIHLADVIQSFKEEDVVPLRGSPRFNTKRRTSIPVLRSYMRSSSTSRLSELDADQISLNSAASSKCPTELLQRRLSHSLSMGADSGPRSASLSAAASYGGQKERGGLVLNWDCDTDSLMSGVSSKMSAFSQCSYQSAASILPFLEMDTSNLPRVVVLQRSAKGFGFVIRGNKVNSPNEFKPTPETPALQYLDKVDENTPAERAGLRQGDFILEINNDSVVSMSHEKVVDLIRNSGDTVALKVVTVDKEKLAHQRKLLQHLDATLAEYELDRLSLVSGYSEITSAFTHNHNGSSRSRRSSRSALPSDWSNSPNHKPNSEAIGSKLTNRPVDTDSNSLHNGPASARIVAASTQSSQMRSDSPTSNSSNHTSSARHSLIMPTPPAEFCGDPTSNLNVPSTPTLTVPNNLPLPLPPDLDKFQNSPASGAPAENYWSPSTPQDFPPPPPGLLTSATPEESRPVKKPQPIPPPRDYSSTVSCQPMPSTSTVPAVPLPTNAGCVPVPPPLPPSYGGNAPAVPQPPPPPPPPSVGNAPAPPPLPVSTPPIPILNKPTLKTCDAKPCVSAQSSDDHESHLKEAIARRRQRLEQSTEPLNSKVTEEGRPKTNPKSMVFSSPALKPILKRTPSLEPAEVMRSGEVSKNFGNVHHHHHQHQHSSSGQVTKVPPPVPAKSSTLSQPGGAQIGSVMYGRSLFENGMGQQHSAAGSKPAVSGNRISQIRQIYQS